MTAPSDERLSPRVHPDRGAPLRVEVILVGTDLLRGKVGDRNARPIADAVTARGGRIHRVTVVSDDLASIAAALREALARNPHLVITTGGLGPAADDRTLEAAAEVLARPLAMSPTARKFVEHAYARLHQSRILDRAGLDRLREKLCLLPVGGQPVANPHGLPPGAICKLAGGATVLCLPGRTEEMKAVLEAGLAELKELLHRRCVVQREVEAPTADEASLRPLIERLADEHPEVGFTTRPVGTGRKGSKVLIALEATAPSEDEAAKRVDEALRRLLTIVGGGG